MSMPDVTDEPAEPIWISLIATCLIGVTFMPTAAADDNYAAFTQCGSATVQVGCTYQYCWDKYVLNPTTGH